MNYLKENFKFIYSLVLIVFIPVAIIVSSFYSIQNTRKQMDEELKSKATMAEAVFAASVADITSEATLLQAKIDQVVTADQEIAEISVFKSQSDGFFCVASSNEQSLNLTFQTPSYTTAWVEDQASATLVRDSNDSNQRYWVIINPIKGHDLQKQALAVFKISLAGSDLATKKAVTQSLIILAVTIFFVLLLLINHFRFYEYAVSFKSLKEIDRMKDDFISIASHEMKTPMAAIKGYLSMIDEGIAGSVDKKAKDHLDKVNANVRRLDTLVDELLDVSRLEQQRVTFDMQPLDMTVVVKNIIGELKVKADEKKLYLKIQELPTPHQLVFADQERVAQVLDNLIGNAIKYTEKGGVEVTYQIEDGQLYTNIRDTGIGIADADQKRLFEKFYRVQNKHTMDIPGTGLGLWITREMVRRMNGDIAVISQEGVGSQFIVNFSTIKEK